MVGRSVKEWDPAPRAFDYRPTVQIPSQKIAGRRRGVGEGVDVGDRELVGTQKIQFIWNVRKGQNSEIG